MAALLFSKVRNNFLSPDSDGTTVYETAVCRSLRSFYTENHRPWPATYNPDRDHESRKGRDIYDPDAIKPASAPVQAVMAPPSRYGGGYGQPVGESRAGSGGSQLGNLWNKPAGGDGGGNGSEVNSLRKGRSPGMQNTAFSRPPQTSQPSPFDNQAPPQRAGYEKTSVSKFRQDRSKLGRPGQRSDSPSSNLGAGSRFNSYGSNASSAQEGSYGRSTEKPQMSATVQFGSQDEYSGYEGGYDQGSTASKGPGRRMGLPSGPRGNRG